MQAVVPAAGEGTRLRPLTETRPKALVEVAGKSILTHCLEELHPLPVEEVVVVVGHRGQRIVDNYGESFEGLSLSYVWQHEREGLAHAVLQAEAEIDGPFLLLNGDSVPRMNVGDVIATRERDGVDGTTLVTEVSARKARTSGAIEVAGDRIVDIVEKSCDPPSRLVNAGCYTLPPEVFRACRLLRRGVEGEYQLSDAVAVLCRAGYQFVPVQMEGWRVNVNTTADIERARERLGGDP